MASEWGSAVDYEGTSIKTKYAYSVFKWRFKEYRKTIQHPIHGLPERVINDSNSGIFSTFCHFCSAQASGLWAHFCSYSTRAKSVSSIYAPHSVMRYSCDGYTSPCQIIHVDNEDGVSPVISIKLQCGRILRTSPEHLQHLADPDVASVPSTVAEYQKQVDSLSDEDLSFLANPQALEPVEKE